MYIVNRYLDGTWRWLRGGGGGGVITMIVIVLQVVWMPNNMYSEREIKLYNIIDLQWEHNVT